MRLFRRNALGVYAVYAAAMVSGLVVTPVVLDAMGTEAFGIWAVIGAITIYLSVLDLGVGPVDRPVRRRGARQGRSGGHQCARFGRPRALRGDRRSRRCRSGSVWPGSCRRSSRHPTTSSGRHASLPSSSRCRSPRASRWASSTTSCSRSSGSTSRTSPSFISTVLYAVLVATLIPTGGGLILLGALTLATTLVRLVLPARLAAVRAPGAAVQPGVRHPSAAPRADVLQLEQLPRPRGEQDRLLRRRRRRRDRARRTGSSALRDPGEALQPRVRPRQRRVRTSSIRRSPSTRAQERRRPSGGCSWPACAAAPPRRSCSRCRCS